MGRLTVASVQVNKFSGNSKQTEQDLLAVEEPLEIRLNYGPGWGRIQKSIAVTMRTPGNDFELALGFLYNEGIIRKKQDVLSIRYCEKAGADEEQENVVLLELNSSLTPDIKNLERNFYTTSACGVCGKVSIEAIEARCEPELLRHERRASIEASVILRLPEIVREQQLVFEHTGGLHAAALFDFDGRLIFLREDIGRHNAVDKISGALLQTERLPASSSILFLSGRAGFELLQKAAMSGIPCVASVGAPSSLAVSLAEKFNITLIGFLRDRRFNIYSSPEMITNT
jgi:FdhD protein